MDIPASPSWQKFILNKVPTNQSWHQRKFTPNNLYIQALTIAHHTEFRYGSMLLMVDLLKQIPTPANFPLSVSFYRHPFLLNPEFWLFVPFFFVFTQLLDVYPSIEGVVFLTASMFIISVPLAVTLYVTVGRRIGVRRFFLLVSNQSDSLEPQDSPRFLNIIVRLGIGGRLRKMAAIYSRLKESGLVGQMLYLDKRSIQDMIDGKPLPSIGLDLDTSVPDDPRDPIYSNDDQSARSMSVKQRDTSYTSDESRQN